MKSKTYFLTWQFLWQHLHILFSTKLNIVNFFRLFFHKLYFSFFFYSPLFQTFSNFLNHPQPKENHNVWCLIYFISFLLLVGFFVLNMFVGVVVENFHKCREDQEEEERLRREIRYKKKMERKKQSLWKKSVIFFYMIKFNKILNLFI